MRNMSRFLYNIITTGEVSIYPASARSRVNPSSERDDLCGGHDYCWGDHQCPRPVVQPRMKRYMMLGCTISMLIVL